MELEKLKLALETPRFVSDASAWVGHIPFAFAAVALLRPRVIVELGTHMGDSYCAFCQAVEMGKVEARCAAVDTWAGDSQSGAYDAAVLDGLRDHHDGLYGGFSRLVQSTFDDAAKQFEAGSIDLLHIDGLHTYDAVRHDFETWLPKVSRRGVILLHDTQVRERDFGVHRLWEEVSGRYRSFEFQHGYGLGVLAVGEEIPAAFEEFLEWGRGEPESVRRFFSALGGRIELARGIARFDEALRRHRSILVETLASCGWRPGPEEVPEMNAGDLLAEGVDLKQWMDNRTAGVGEASELVRALRDHLGRVIERLGEADKHLSAAQRRAMARRD